VFLSSLLLPPPFPSSFLLPVTTSRFLKSTSKQPSLLFLFLLSKTLAGRGDSFFCLFSIPSLFFLFLPRTFLLYPSSSCFCCSSSSCSPLFKMHNLLTAPLLRTPALKYACASAYQPCTTHPISPSLPNFLGKSSSSCYSSPLPLPLPYHP
jgi:hypothetical protein